MNCLPYGIFAAPGDARRRDGTASVPGMPATGVQGRPVRVVTEAGLAAAFSLVPAACAEPSVARVKAYARVVAALHGLGPVIPVRYGAFLASPRRLIELLRERRTEFTALLGGLEGCEEMSLHFLADSAGTGATCVSTTAAPTPWPPEGPPGTAYLARRRDRYAAQDADAAGAARLAEAVRSTFAGLFVKCRIGRSSEGRLLSLHFLTRHHDREAFRETFRRVQEDTTCKMLLTGPWPPYNFVSMDHLREGP